MRLYNYGMLLTITENDATMLVLFVLGERLNSYNNFHGLFNHCAHVFDYYILFKFLNNKLISDFIYYY